MLDPDDQDMTTLTLQAIHLILTVTMTMTMTLIHVHIHLILLTVILPHHRFHHTSIDDGLDTNTANSMTAVTKDIKHLGKRPKFPSPPLGDATIVLRITLQNHALEQSTSPQESSKKT
jgi:hypothetical protein